MQKLQVRHGEIDSTEGVSVFASFFLSLAGAPSTVVRGVAKKGGRDTRAPGARPTRSPTVHLQVEAIDVNANRLFIHSASLLEPLNTTSGRRLQNGIQRHWRA